MLCQSLLGMRAQIGNASGKDLSVATQQYCSISFCKLTIYNSELIHLAIRNVRTQTRQCSPISGSQLFFCQFQWVLFHPLTNHCRIPQLHFWSQAKIILFLSSLSSLHSLFLYPLQHLQPKQDSLVIKTYQTWKALEKKPSTFHLIYLTHEISNSYMITRFRISNFQLLTKTSNRSLG